MRSLDIATNSTGERCIRSTESHSSGSWETRAFELGGSDYFAPGQLVGDFLKRQRSTDFGGVLPSYTPGVRLTDLAQPGHGSLPDYVLDAIREAMPAFDRQIKGFAMPDAVFTGVETRTSSPLRITRGADLQSVNVQGLYPAGEGAGYAGGIMSAGVDGIEVAEAVARAMLHIRSPMLCREFRLQSRLRFRLIGQRGRHARTCADGGVTREIAAFRRAPLTGRARAMRPRAVTPSAPPAGK